MAWNKHKKRDKPAIHKLTAEKLETVETDETVETVETVKPEKQVSIVEQVTGKPYVKPE